MKEELKIVKIDTKYCNYLRKFDSRVPYNYGKKALRPFVGVLFRVGNFMYFAPLSSPKAKHLNMKAKIDFLKIDNGKLGVVNFNNMLPVTKTNITLLDLNGVHKKFVEQKYNKLLKEQLYWLNRNKEKLYNRAQKLYEKYINKTLNISIRERCCDFKLLEEKCGLYNLILEKVNT